MSYHRWNSRYNDDDMADDCNCQCNADGVIAAKVCVCDVGTEQWNKVDPELIER